MRAPPRKVLLAAQLVAAALLLFFIGRVLIGQWTAFRATPLEAQPRWSDILASGALVLATYALLVETWSLMLRTWGGSLSYWNAARIWSISNLGRYVPGKIWQITAMGVMAQRAGVSPVASTGSALISTIVNIAAGIAIVVVLGWRWLDRVRPDARGVAISLVVLSVVGLMLLPFLMPRVSKWVARVSGRQFELQAPPRQIIAIAIVGNLLAWLIYGVAFWLLVRGVLGEASGAIWQYIAVYSASYVVGYLFLFLPGGIGPREMVMASLLPALALATPKQAWLVAGASRVWLTILELLPGLLFLAYDASRQGSRNKPPTDVSTE